MNLLFEIVIQQGFILDLFGVIGLGLLGLGAVRMASRYGTKNARLMTWGALAMLTGRVGYLMFAKMLTAVQRAEWSDYALFLAKNIPIGLLTFGLGAIVLGFWSHERETSPVIETGEAI